MNAADAAVTEFHALSDEDATEYLSIGIKATEIVRLRWPDISDEDADFVLWERTPFPVVSGIHDIADAVADLEDPS